MMNSRLDRGPRVLGGPAIDHIVGRCFLTPAAGGLSLMRRQVARDALALAFHDLLMGMSDAEIARDYLDRARPHLAGAGPDEETTTAEAARLIGVAIELAWGAIAAMEAAMGSTELD